VSQFPCQAERSVIPRRVIDGKTKVKVRLCVFGFGMWCFVVGWCVVCVVAVGRVSLLVGVCVARKFQGTGIGRGSLGGS